MLKSAVRRSACDQCRAKRVRCLRAQDSIAPCARCSYVGARCVTGASGHPGRPLKQRLVDSGSTRRCTPGNQIVTPSPLVQRTSTLSVVHPLSPGGLVSQEAQPEFWEPPDGLSGFFGAPSFDRNLAPGQNGFSTIDQLGSPSQLERFSTDEELNAMLHLGEGSSTMLDMTIDPFLDHGKGTLSQAPFTQRFGATERLWRFREEVDERIVKIDAYYSEDPIKVLQSCKDGAVEGDDENPAALLLTYSKELIDIIQSLAPTDHLPEQTEATLSTEIVLLALSSYLALLRLFDHLFKRIYRYVCQMPPGLYKSMKVKSVLRIGGVSSLQDMPLKAYAIGILDAIQCQVQTLERCMGIPAEHCLSGNAIDSSTTATPGLFCRPDRAQLFWTTMSQEDVKSQRGSKSYVESIRSSIKDSMAFLDD